MRHAQVAAVSLFVTLHAALPISIEAAEADGGRKQKPSWEKVWNKKVDAQIRSVIRQVDSERMSKDLFALAKDPLPYRKLNFTLPGHEKNTLYEADDYIAARLDHLHARSRRCPAVTLARGIFGAQYPAHRCLCLRFASLLAATDARPEVRMESLLLSCRVPSSPTTCRFIPALSVTVLCEHH